MPQTVKCVTLALTVYHSISIGETRPLTGGPHFIAYHHRIVRESLVCENPVITSKSLKALQEDFLQPLIHRRRFYLAVFAVLNFYIVEPLAANVNYI